MLSLNFRRALKGITLDVALDAPGGEVTAVFGPSGVGKSSIINILCGDLDADEGRAALGDTVLFDTPSGHGLAPDARGERQWGALARAVLSGPRVLLLDEPFSALDVALREAVMDAVLAAGREMSVPARLVSHSVIEIKRLAASVHVLEEGRIKASGTPDTVLP